VNSGKRIVKHLKKKFNMTLEEAIVLARQGVKMTHRYFSSNEFMTMKGNLVIFEDGVEIYLSDWVGDKQWLIDGWSRFEN
jgi:hypothetical protein